MTPMRVQLWLGRLLPASSVPFAGLVLAARDLSPMHPLEFSNTKTSFRRASESLHCHLHAIANPENPKPSEPVPEGGRALRAETQGARS